MKSLVLLVDSSGFGGIESHLLQLSRLSKKKGIHTQVVFLKAHKKWNTHPLVKQLMHQGIACFFLAGKFGDWAAFCWQKRKRILVHAHGYKAILWARLSGVLFSVPCLATYHAGETPTGRVRFYQALMYGTGYFSENLVVSSRLLHHVRAQLLPNFVELTDRKVRDRHERLQIAFVGRDDWVKGLDRYVRLAEIAPQWDWHVFGCSSENDAVMFHGTVASMMAHWQQIDVLLMPSRAEGLPMAALEAMMQGVPVLATDVGDLPALLPKDWQVPEPNWEELKDKLHALDKGDWQVASAVAREKVEAGYSAESAWQKLKLVYGVNDSGLSK